MPAVTITDNRTYATMRGRIADEIKKGNIDNYIANAVMDAVYFYSQKNFFFNENYDNSTVMTAGTNIYAGPDDLITPIELTVQIGSQGLILPLNRRSLGWILALDVNVPGDQGQPTDWCEFQNQFRFWPTPDSDSVYTIGFYYQGLIPPPVQDTDAGFWMTTGEMMIRTFAKGLLYQEYFKRADLAQPEFELSNRQFLQLSGQNAAKLFTGSTKPTKF